MASFIKKFSIAVEFVTAWKLNPSFTTKFTNNSSKRSRLMYESSLYRWADDTLDGNSTAL
jgi:hypothetical protein